MEVGLGSKFRASVGPDQPLFEPSEQTVRGSQSPGAILGQDPSPLPRPSGRLCRTDEPLLAGHEESVPDHGTLRLGVEKLLHRLAKWYVLISLLRLD